MFHNSEQTRSIIALIREWLGPSVDQSPPPNQHPHHLSLFLSLSLSPSLSHSPMSCSTFCSVICAQTFQTQQSRSLQNHSYHWAIKFCQKVRNNRNDIYQSIKSNNVCLFVCTAYLENGVSNVLPNYTVG